MLRAPIVLSVAPDLSRREIGMSALGQSPVTSHQLDSGDIGHAHQRSDQHWAEYLVLTKYQIYSRSENAPYIY